MKFKKYFISALMSAMIAFGAYHTNISRAEQDVAAKDKSQVIQVVPSHPASHPALTPIKTSSLDIVANPNKFLNKRVDFTAKFDKFSTLGLDYSRATRSSQQYIAFLIQRDDSVDHNIPLSEMKLFLKRDYAEKFIELETGDKIEISAVVFATALGDPWLDVDKIVIKEKVKKSDKSDKEEADISKK